MPDSPSRKNSDNRPRIRGVARAAVRLDRNRPYFEWLASLVPNPEPGVDLAAEYERSDVTGATIYLIPYFAEDFDSEMFVAEHYDLIFDHVLGVAADEKDWPPTRTFAMFNEWFTLTHHRFVDDLGSGPYELDEDSNLLGIEAPPDADAAADDDDDEPDLSL